MYVCVCVLHVQAWVCVHACICLAVYQAYMVVCVCGEFVKRGIRNSRITELRNKQKLNSRET